MNTHDLCSLHTIYNSLTRVDNRCENAMSYILPSNIFALLQRIPINVTKAEALINKSS